MNLYDQLLALQVIPDAFTTWQDYRKALSGYIMERLPRHHHIGVFGAGRCNDLDLDQLVSYFDHVTLIDQDLQGMQAALTQYHLEDSPKVTLKQIECTGITSKSYRHYADRLVSILRAHGKEMSYDNLVQAALDELETMSHYLKQPDFGTALYDSIVVSGMHSQLLTMLEWIWHVVLETISGKDERVRQYIMNMNDTFIQQFNTALCKATKHHLIVGLETQRIGQVGRVQGAMQGIIDFQMRLYQGELYLKDQGELIWPFNPAKAHYYQMILLDLIKLKH